MGTTSCSTRAESAGPGEETTFDVGAARDLDGWCPAVGHSQMGVVFTMVHSECGAHGVFGVTD